MNITDLIVDFIKQGGTVEFPEMGTLSSTQISAHHDAATGTYYPARRTVQLSATQSGNKSVVRRIAERECVSTDVAEQMWSNYVSALNDKLQRNSEGHEFVGLGTLRRVGGKMVFDALQGLDLDADKKQELPLEHVATYTPKTTVDPFAAFEKPAPVLDSEPAPEPQPAPVSEKEPEPMPEPVSQPAPEPTPIQEATPEKVSVPEPAPVSDPEPEPAPIPEPVFIPMPETVHADPNPQPKQSDHLSEVKRMLDEIPASNTDSKAARRAAKAAAKATAKAEKAARKAEAEAKKAAAQKAKSEKKAASKPERTVAPNTSKPVETEKEEKKKGRAWLWILILLLLALLGGAAYYYFTRVYTPKATVGSCARNVELSYRDQFTGDRALLRFDDSDIHRTTGQVHDYMADYVRNFLLARHYGNAFAAVMSRVDEYSDNRLRELMVEGYCVKRFFPYTDFWMEHNYGEYKDAGAYYYRYQVQKELLDLDLLDNILDDVVLRLGLRPDAYGNGVGYGDGGRAAAAKAAARAAADKPYVEVVPDAPTFKNSKQGFDIIAGFFTSKTAANKCANQLKVLGSDAYIISKSGGYYVSMGSAPTRTAAEAMEKHIKSWYKSDVKIYNFNE